jgi:glucose/arabinose dehydrogenase
MDIFLENSSVFNDELNNRDRQSDLNSFSTSNVVTTSLEERLLPLETTSFQPSQNNIIFVDPAVRNHQKLLADLDTKVVVLDAKRNGIEQISEVLKQHQNLTSVEIFSHGTTANLDLGSARLGLDTLGENTGALQDWSKALASNADILLYGCNVAQGKAGHAFVEELGKLTQADIAASDDLTGNAALGGDWQLEVKTGEIEAESSISQDAIAAYKGILNTRVEAESMTRQTYRLESNSSASGRQLISLAGRGSRERGTASFTFNGTAGAYDVIVGYYDENDGVSQMQVAQNGTTLDAWNFDANLGSSSPNATTLTTRAIARNRTVNGGDRFVLSGRENGNENARVDYIEFVPVPTTTAPSRLALESNAYSFDENSGNATVSVVRTGETNQTVSLNYRTFDNTATAGSDYTATSGTLTFAAGQTSSNVSIPLLDDRNTEANETFSFVIDNIVGNGTLGAPRTARVTIVDNETPPPPVRIIESNGNTQVTEGGATDSYSLVLSRQPSANVSIGIAPNNQLTTSTATATFTPANWNVTQNVTVSAVDDQTQEGIHTGLIDHTVTSSDPTFNGFDLRDLTASINDNDIGAFVIETFAAGLNSPTAFDWTPNGQQMFVAQKNGVVRVVDNGNLNPTPFIDISAQVNDVRDRGLLGLAVHPNFPSTPYVYLAFTYDPPETAQSTGLAAPDREGNRPSRVIRVTADASTNFTTAVPGSEVVLLGTNSTFANTSRPDGNSTNDFSIPPSGIAPDGTNIQDYLATDSESHTIGALNFGTDGSLFVSNGDGTSYNNVDPRTVRVQDINNLSGKLLRIDPISGDGLSNNPFFDGNPDSNRSKVYSYGLRNPFRFTVNPSTGEPFIGDVGWTEWEEINTGRGVNFGWPYFEGGSGTSIRRSGYQDLPEAQAFYASGQPVTPSVYALSHANGAEAIVMGDFYTGTTFPEIYRGGLFFSDFGESNVRYLKFDANGNFSSVNTFATGIPGIVQLSQGPDSHLYFADLQTGQISRWRYDGDAIAPSPGLSLDRRDDLIVAPRNRFTFA